MFSLLFILIAILAAVLCLVVLIQSPKGRGLDSAMGGQAATQILGASQSADFIEKLTWGLGGTIIVLCLVTLFMSRPASSTPAKPATGSTTITVSSIG